MERLLKIVAFVIIASGIFLGVRYWGSVIHYTCENPAEDCPPPINGVGEIAFYATGGPLVPLYRK